MSDEIVDLNGPLDVRLPNGEIYRLQPGRAGLSVRAIQEHSAQGPGRPPRPGTRALRERLAEDAQKGDLRPAAEYVTWMRRHDPEVAPATARQIVYRERRLVIEAQGRQASPRRRKAASR